MIKVKAGIPKTMDSDDLPTFQTWMDRIDRFISRAAGCSVQDLVDCPFMDWYEARLRPIHAANKALKRSGQE